MLHDLLNNVFYDVDFKHRCLEQKLEMDRHIVRIQRYEYRNELSAINPVIAIRSWKKIVIPLIYVKLHTSKLSVTDLLNKKGLMDTLCKIKIRREKRRIGNECLLKLLPSPELHLSITLTNADG